MMDRTRLMRKKKTELLHMLKERRKKTDPKALKKELVDLLLEIQPDSAPRAEADAVTPEEAPRPPAEASHEPVLDESASTTAAEHAQEGERMRATELPQGYGEDRIVAMVRDPHWVFAYWELTPGGIERTGRELGEDGGSMKVVLRVHDTTGIAFTGENARGHFDIAVGDATNWYIETGRPDSSYCLDIGLLGPSGSYKAIARSNTVHTPRADMSDEVDERWLGIEEGAEPVPGLHTAFPVGESSAELIEMMKKQLRIHEEAGGSLFSMTTQQKQKKP